LCDLIAERYEQSFGGMDAQTNAQFAEPVLSAVMSFTDALLEGS
jgi:hypothetical protein